MATSAAPKAGTPASKAPAATKTAAVKTVPASGTKVAPKPVAAAAAPKAAPYPLPPIDPSLIVRIFEGIPEYRQYKIVNLDTLIRGMLLLATSPLAGVGPGGVSVTSTPYANFVGTLLQMAVEKGSKGVMRNS